ncbi:MAG: aspartyl protease family protein [Geminicoccaceae bacterium]
MPCIAGVFEPKVGLLLNVAIHKTDLLTTINAKPRTEANLTLYTALVDTGASCTCVSKRVISEIGLVPHTKVTMVSASSNHDVNAYYFIVGIPIFLASSPMGSVSGKMHMFNEPVQGMELLNPTGRFDVLLGMDVIGRGSLKLDHDRHFSFCF